MASIEYWLLLENSQHLSHSLENLLVRLVSISWINYWSMCKPRPPDPRDIAGDVTFLQCYISTFTPALGGIWTVTIPAPRAPVSKALRALPSRGVWGHAPPENFEILYSQRRIFLHSEALNGKYETC